MFIGLQDKNNLEFARSRGAKDKKPRRRNSVMSSLYKVAERLDSGNERVGAKMRDFGKSLSSRGQDRLERGRNQRDINKMINDSFGQPKGLREKTKDLKIRAGAALKRGTGKAIDLAGRGIQKIGKDPLLAGTIALSATTGTISTASYLKNRKKRKSKGK
jgi:hypothetical protein